MPKKDRRTLNKLRSSYITTVISISLVLFLLGIIGFLLLNAKKISDHVKENINIGIILKDNVKEADIIYLQKQLDASEYVKSTEFVSKDKAAELLQKDLGEDFVTFLGYNPLLSSINAKLYAEYANNDSIAKIKKQLKKYSQIQEVFYQENLVQIVNQNIKKISLILLILSLFLLLISISLINNTIRLAVYSKRFIIYTMQLVGASRGFIRTPFILTAILQGAISALFANALLLMLISWLQQQFSGIIYFKDLSFIILLIGSIFIIGILITAFSTFFAINRQLNSKLDKLYYG
ncbi:MAG TPA: cell division protein FtsX [Bacteroidales bacterium]|nr:cell division protein FtsX [Bacteroidales bacterium]